MLLTFTPTVVLAADIVEIESRRELFVDDLLIGKMDGTRLKMHEPVLLRSELKRPFGHYATVLKDGDRFQWEEYEFEIHFAPGQTEFHSVYAGVIDGRKVAFTGDNYFVAEVLTGGKTEMKPYQTTVLRNSFQLAMHRRCAEVMRKISPELICPGHRDVLPCFKQDLDTYCDFIARKERAFRALVVPRASS